MVEETNRLRARRGNVGVAKPRCSGVHTDTQAWACMRRGHQRDPHHDPPRAGDAPDARGARPDGRMRGDLLAPGISPPIPTYNSVPTAQAVSFPTTTRDPGAATQLMARPPLGHRAWRRPAGGAAGARADPLRSSTAHESHAAPQPWTLLHRRPFRWP